MSAADTPGDHDNVIDLADCRPVTPEERLEVVAAMAADGLGRGPDVACEVLVALAAALADLAPEAGL